MGGGPPCFPPGFTCPAVLWVPPFGFVHFAYGGLALSARPFHASSAMHAPAYGRPATPRRSPAPVWALPCSLAATWGIDVSFSSSGYLDVSVPRVAFSAPICSARDACALPQASSLIRKSAVVTAVCALPQLIAACHVLLRLLVPRHPPRALLRLTIFRAARAGGAFFPLFVNQLSVIFSSGFSV